MAGRLMMDLMLASSSYVYIHNNSNNNNNNPIHASILSMVSHVSTQSATEPDRRIHIAWASKSGGRRNLGSSETLIHGF